MARVRLGWVGSLDEQRSKPEPLHRRAPHESRRGYMRKRNAARRARNAENRANLGTWPFPS